MVSSGYGSASRRARECTGLSQLFLIVQVLLATRASASDNVQKSFTANIGSVPFSVCGLYTISYDLMCNDTVLAVVGYPVDCIGTNCFSPLFLSMGCTSSECHVKYDGPGENANELCLIVGQASGSTKVSYCDIDISGTNYLPSTDDSRWPTWMIILVSVGAGSAVLMCLVCIIACISCGWKGCRRFWCCQCGNRSKVQASSFVVGPDGKVHSMYIPPESAYANSQANVQMAAAPSPFIQAQGSIISAANWHQQLAQQQQLAVASQGVYSNYSQQRQQVQQQQQQNQNQDIQQQQHRQQQPQLMQAPRVQSPPSHSQPQQQHQEQHQQQAMQHQQQPQPMQAPQVQPPPSYPQQQQEHQEQQQQAMQQQQQPQPVQAPQVQSTPSHPQQQQQQQHQEQQQQAMQEQQQPQPLQAPQVQSAPSHPQLQQSAPQQQQAPSPPPPPEPAQVQHQP